VQLGFQKRQTNDDLGQHQRESCASCAWFDVGAMCHSSPMRTLRLRVVREAGEVCRTMVSLLQQKADVCGARIISYELADLQYAPEIAAQMLVRQQAEALVEARFTIVEGAVQIVSSAVEKLRDRGIGFTPHEQSRLVSNLLAVICGDSHVTPTFSISEGVGSDQDDGVSAEHNRLTLEMLQRIAVNTTPAKG